MGRKIIKVIIFVIILIPVFALIKQISNQEPTTRATLVSSTKGYGEYEDTDYNFDGTGYYVNGNTNEEYKSVYRSSLRTKLVELMAEAEKSPSEELTAAIDIVDTAECYYASKEFVEIYLKQMNYSDEVIEEAMKLSGMDWNEQARDAAIYYIMYVEIPESSLEETLRNELFTEEEIDYALRELNIK